MFHRFQIVFNKSNQSYLKFIELENLENTGVRSQE